MLLKASPGKGSLHLVVVPSESEDNFPQAKEAPEIPEIHLGKPR